MIPISRAITLALVVAPTIAHAEPLLRFERATEASEINRRLGEPKLSESLRLVSMTNDEIKDLRIAVPDLRDADGHVITLTATVPGKDITKPIAIPALDAITVALTADLPELGVYSTNIVLTYAGKRTITKLTVDRIRPKLALEILGAPATRLEIAPWGRSDAHLDLILRDTAGAKQKIDTIELTAWGIEDAGDRFQQSGTVELREAKNGELEVAPNESKRVRAVFAPIDEAGRHKGTLRLANENTSPVELAITVVARVHWLMAALLIAVGVWISHHVRVFLTRRRKNLVRRRILEEAEAELIALAKQARGTDLENDLLAKLTQNLRDLAQKLARKEDDTATENEALAFRAKVRVLDDWLAASAQLTKIRNVELANRVRGALGSVAGALREAKTPEEVAAAEKELRAIEINEQLLTELTTRAAELRAEVATRRGTLAASAQEILDREVLPRLDKIHPSSSAPFDDMLATLDDARRSYVRALALALTESLEQTPIGFDENSRKVLERRVRLLLADLDKAGADEAARRYEIAYRAYMTELAAKLGDVVAELRSGMQNASPTDDEMKQLGDMERRQKELAQVAAAKPIEAAAPHAQLSADVSAMVERFTVGEKVISSGKKGEAPPRAAASALIPGGVVAAEQTRRWTSRSAAAMTQAEIDRSDLYVTLAMGFLLVLTGVRLLWTTDPTWGGFEDYAVAFLWGAGLHQIAGATFESFQGLRTKLEGP